MVDILSRSHSSVAELLQTHPQIWVKRCIQASRLLQHEAALRDTETLLPDYATEARAVGDVPDTEHGAISYDTLLRERADLLKTLESAIATILEMENLYGLNHPNQRDFRVFLARFKQSAIASCPLQETVADYCEQPFNNYKKNQIEVLNGDKKFIPDNDVLRKSRRTRKQTEAIFDQAISALEFAYTQLQIFQDRLSKLHERVLPKLQEKYANCADALASICTETAEGILDNPAQYFAAGKESQKLPNEGSEAYIGLRRTLAGLRSREGGYGMTKAKTAGDDYVKFAIDNALLQADRERKEVTGAPNGTAILAAIDAALAPAAAESPTQEKGNPSSSPEEVGKAGKVSTHSRGLLARVLGRWAREINPN